MLKKIELPMCITNVGWKAFMDCHSLEKVTLPESITNISKDAFVSCYIQELTISAGVESIGENAFPQGMTLHVPPGSYAETYAQENGLTYKVV